MDKNIENNVLFLEIYSIILLTLLFNNKVYNFVVFRNLLGIFTNFVVKQQT